MSATIAEPREQEVPCVLNFAVNLNQERNELVPSWKLER